MFGRRSSIPFFEQHHPARSDAWLIHHLSRTVQQEPIRRWAPACHATTLPAACFHSRLELVLHACKPANTQSRVGIPIELIVHHHRAGIGLIGQITSFGKERPVFIDVPSRTQIDKRIGGVLDGVLIVRIKAGQRPFDIRRDPPA